LRRRRGEHRGLTEDEERRAAGLLGHPSVSMEN
jgi:hypothetical protein